MHYNYGLEFSAILFLIILAGRFFEVESLPTYKNKAYGWFIICAIIDGTFDILSSIAIESVGVVNPNLIYAICSIFYSFRALISFLFLIYIFINIGKLNSYRKRLYIFSLPLIMYFGVIIMNCFTPILFSISNGAFIKETLYMSIYVVVTVYFIFSTIFLIVFKKTMERKQFQALSLTIIVIVVAMVIQIFYPDLLVSGVAISLAITSMYFLVQNTESMIDIVTGTFNYSALITYVDDCIKWERKYGVIYLDIHGISGVNQLYGIEGGDIILKEISSFLSSHSDLVFRVMGTKFLLMFTDVNRYEKNKQIIAHRFNESWQLDNLYLDLEVDIATLKNLRTINSCQELIRSCELVCNDTLFENDTNIYSLDEDALSYLNRLMDLELLLQEGIREDKYLSIRIQPVYNLKNNNYTSGEALLRFNHPSYGDVSPNEFIPLAEKKGLVIKVDEFVINKVCQFIQNNDIHSLGIETIAVNLSAVEFADSNMADRILGIVDSYNINHEMITFELTETVASSNNQRLKLNMGKLIAAGFKFSLDDFGSGYANLTQVLSLPFTAVKIDRTILLGPRVVLEDMIEMFKHINIKMIVEGVETKHQIDFLKKLDVNYIQGYYYSRPLTVSQFIEFLSKD